MNKRLFIFALFIAGFLQVSNLCCMNSSESQKVTISKKTAFKYETNKISDVLNYAFTGAFAFFDIDGTLTKIKDGNYLGGDWWAYYEGDKYEAAYLQKGYTKAEAFKKGLLAFDDCWTLVQNNVGMELVEEGNKAKAVIDELPKKSVPVVVGFTARGTKLADRTKEQLKSFNFNFSYTNITFKGDGFLFKHGIIFVEPGANKGKTLLNFLKKFGQNCLGVIFVDDKVKNVTSVADACNDVQMPCQSILYTAIHKEEEKLKNDVHAKMICDMQLYHLRNYQELLFADNAKKILDNSDNLDKILKHIKNLDLNSYKQFVFDLKKNKGDFFRQVV
jgi:hypothetical protein